MPGPAGDEGHAVAALPHVRLHSAQRPDTAMGVLGDVLGVPHRPVVAGEDHQRIVGHAQGVELVEHLADDAVDLGDKVAVVAALALSLVLWRRQPGRVRGRHGKVEQQRLGGVALAVLVQQGQGLLAEFRQHIGVLEAGGDPAGPPELALDAPHVGRVVLVDAFGRSGHGPVVLDVVIRRDVQRGRDAEVVVEPAVRGPAAQKAAFLLLEAQVPLAHHGRAIPGRLEHRGDCGVVVSQAVLFRAERIPARDEPVAARHAQTDGRVGVGELHSPGRQAVDVGRGAFGVRVEAPRIAVAHVVGEEKDDVGLGGAGGGGDLPG